MFPFRLSKASIHYLNYINFFDFRQVVFGSGVDEFHRVVLVFFNKRKEFAE